MAARCQHTSVGAIGERRESTSSHASPDGTDHRSTAASIVIFDRAPGRIEWDDAPTALPSVTPEQTAYSDRSPGCDRRGGGAETTPDKRTSAQCLQEDGC